MQLLPLFLMISIFSLAEMKELLPDYTLDKSTKETSLSPDRSIFKFTFDGIEDRSEHRMIAFSIDGNNHKKFLSDKNTLEVSTSPGKHVFVFYYRQDYVEIFTDTILIKPQYIDEYTIYMRRSDIIYEVEKPVIYLYPETKMDVSISVKTGGSSLFTYPQMDAGWSVTAFPNGELLHQGKTYNYLFWEAEQPGINSSWSEGFGIHRAEVIHFLEEKLTAFGLNSKEQADFITYWGPKMIKHEQIVLKFMFNEECNRFAEIKVSPIPEHINRIYLLWAPVENISDFNYLRAQNVPTINRLGFTVLEWGGVKLTNVQPKQPAL